MDDFTTSAGIAGTAILLANVIVWAFGPSWSPRQKAGIGAIAALAVFIVGLMLWPTAWPDGPTAFTTLFYALVTVLAAAGAPIYRDVLRSEPPADVAGADATGGKRKWTAWNT